MWFDFPLLMKFETCDFLRLHFSNKDVLGCCLKMAHFGQVCATSFGTVCAQSTGHVRHYALVLQEIRLRFRWHWDAEIAVDCLPHRWIAFVQVTFVPSACVWILKYLKSCELSFLCRTLSFFSFVFYFGVLIFIAWSEIGKPVYKEAMYVLVEGAT